MASPQSGRLSITPSSRVLRSPLSDDSIWKRLKEAGLDEESIKRRDKAALIAYIAKLEAEIFDHQHHMGLLILERKELASKYEESKASAEAAELQHKRDQAAHLSALAEAKKREDNLKKALGVEKECIASIEKTLHEMRAESAETKVSADCKLVEARRMMGDAQKKFSEAEAKLHTAESMQAEANRYRRAAERKLQEVEAREEDLTRRMVSFKSDCDEKEKEISVERQSLSERKAVLQQEHERLLDAQALLNQREDYIFGRCQELSRLEKELQASNSIVDGKLRELEEEKSKLELTAASLSKREEAVIEREALLCKKEQELIVSQEKLASKESNEIQKAIANHESHLKMKKLEVEAELEMKRKSVEDEIETRRRAWELKDLDLSQREDTLVEREHELEVQSRILAEKEKDVTERSLVLDEKEKSFTASEKEVDLKIAHLQTEKEEVDKLKLELQKAFSSLDDKRKQVDSAKVKLEAMKSETDELSVLEMKLKEELDIVRSQKLELMAEADKLQVEKAKFETEWELIDEKREELRKEAERVAVERDAVYKFLKDERDSLRQERDAIRHQHKRDVELLNREREEFMNKMVHEHSEWFSKIQQERADFLLGIEMQKRELEDCIEKRREELESSLREREMAFEEEKKKELQQINSLKEKAEKELEHIALEMKRLDAERVEISLDRQRRDREWAELDSSIKELKVQREKLEKQRELLHADRQEIEAQIEKLNELEDLKIAFDFKAVSEMSNSRLERSQKKMPEKLFSEQQNSDFGAQQKFDITDNANGFNSPLVEKTNTASLPSSARFSWIKRCSELIFKTSPEAVKSEKKSGTSENGDTSLAIASNKGQPVRYAIKEPKVILEVPSEEKVVKVMHDHESKLTEDASGRRVQSVSENVSQAGRKRRVNNHASGDCVDPLEAQKQNNKKRRQQEDVPLKSTSDEAIIHCSSSDQKNVPGDQSGLVSSSNAHGVSEETNVLIIDKIIRISEETCEKSVSDNNVAEEKVKLLQNPTAEPDIAVDIPEAQGELPEVLLENVKNVTESSETHVYGYKTQNDIEGENQKLDGDDLDHSDGDEKPDNQIADRTRSKVKS